MNLNRSPSALSHSFLTAFEPATSSALSDQVVGTLRKAIVAGAYAPGDHLPEARTAAQLGVSRVPVREAMLQLEREGLLIFDKRGAALVRELSAEDFEELFSMRLVLEPMAAGLACCRMSDREFDLLEENIAQTRGTTKLLELTLLDIEFHDLVMRAARHSRLLQCWRSLKPQLEVWLHRMHQQHEPSVQRTREATVREHLALLAVLRSGNAERAASRMRKHTEGWREQLPKPAQPANRR